MNRIKGHIKQVAVNGELSIVSVEAEAGVELKAIVVETPKTATYLKKGAPVALLFKETEVVIGIGNAQHISLQNKIEGSLKKLEKGVLLSKLLIATVVGDLTAIISTNAVEQLKLTEGKAVVVMVKLNEVMLLKL